MAKFNLNQLTTDFGQTDKKFNISLAGVIPSAVNALNKFLPIGIPLLDFQDLPTGVSSLGLPVFDSLRFVAGKYTDVRNQTPVSYNGLVLINVVFNASQTKNIVKTMVQGRERSIKEYISSNDILLNINGLIVNDAFPNSYPTREVESFIKLMNVPQSLRVRSKFLQSLDITHITVERWRLTQTVGRRNMQAFSIEATSDIESSINDITGTTEE